MKRTSRDGTGPPTGATGFQIERKRSSPHRATVELARLTASHPGHPTASKLHRQVKAQFSAMSLTTVYSTLDLLRDLGEILEIDLHDHTRYGPNKPPEMVRNFVITPPRQLRGTGPPNSVRLSWSSAIS